MVMYTWWFWYNVYEHFIRKDQCKKVINKYNICGSLYNVHYKINATHTNINKTSGRDSFKVIKLNSNINYLLFYYNNKLL